MISAIYTKQHKTILQIKLLPKVVQSMSRITKAQIKNAIQSYCQSCDEVFQSLKQISNKQIQMMFKIQNMSKQNSLFEPRSISTVDKNSTNVQNLNSKVKNKQKSQCLEKTVRKNQQSEVAKLKQRNQTKPGISPLWARVNSHMSKIKVSYSQMTSDFIQNPQKIETQFEDFMTEMKNMKIRNMIKEKVEEKNDESNEQDSQLNLCNLKTAKKISNEASIGISSHLHSINQFEMGRQILNAPKKQKKYSKIRRIDTLEQKNQKNQQILQKAKKHQNTTGQENIEIAY